MSRKYQTIFIKANQKNLQKSSVNSVIVHNATDSLLPQSLPQLDVIFELVWMCSAVIKYVFSGSLFDVNRVCLFEWQSHQVGHGEEKKAAVKVSRDS